MRIAGIIAEYNPFHRGHAWHISETRRLTDCDYVVVCMDGHFTQRGKPTPFSKWNRARMALACGVDAVFELPALYAVRPAEVFARGGAAILGGLGADVLSFGCETDDPLVLYQLAAVKDNEPKSVSETVQANLSRGMSHARAWGEAAAEYLGLPVEMAAQPNLILATEYIRAVRALGLAMKPIPILRRGSYHGLELGEYASASAIRAAMARGEMTGALQCLPEAARAYAEPERLHPMDDLLLDRLRHMTPEALAHLPEVSEGLEQRLHRLCRQYSERETLLEALKCKRYTRSRLSRTLTHALLGMSRETGEKYPLPRYARLIGLRRGAEHLLSELKERSSLPIASNPSELRGDEVFALEERATDIWALLHDKPALRRPGREYTEKFVRI